MRRRAAESATIVEREEMKGGGKDDTLPSLAAEADGNPADSEVGSEGS